MVPIVALPLLVLTLLVLMMSLSGWGQVLVHGHEQSSPTFFALVIVGLLPLAGLGLLIDFGLPISPRISGIAILFGLGCLAYRWKRVWSSLGDRPILLLALMAVLSVFVVMGAVLTPLNYDTGLYHLQAISWLEHDRKVFGLANLHARLGFNSIWLDDAALLDFWRHGRYGVFLLNGTLYVAVLSDMVQALLARELHFRGEFAVRIYAGFSLVVLLINADFLLFSWVGASPNNDMPVALLVIYAFWLFLRFSHGSPSGPRDYRDRLVLLAGVCVLATMTKLSAFPILLLLPAAAYIAVGAGTGLRRLIGNPGLVFVALVVFVWLANGLATSGCLLFPSAASCFPALPGSVPSTVAHFTAAAITGWARSPTSDYLAAANGWSWIDSWPEKMLARRPYIASICTTFAILLALLACSLICNRMATARSARTTRRGLEEEGICLYGIAVSGAGIVFWFLLAPDPRFGLGFLLSIVLLASCWIVVRFSPQATAAQKLTSTPMAVALVIAVAGLYIEGHRHSAMLAAKSWPSIPVADVRKVALGPEFPAFTPTTSDQCWDAALPCTPEGVESRALLQKSFLLWRTIESYPSPVH
jgi:hypothetical protein